MCKIAPNASRDDKEVPEPLLATHNDTTANNGVVKDLSGMTSKARKAYAQLYIRRRMSKIHAINSCLIPTRHGKRLSSLELFDRLMEDTMASFDAPEPPAPVGKMCVGCRRMVGPTDNEPCWFHPEEMIQTHTTTLDPSQCRPWRYACCLNDFQTKGCCSRKEHVFEGKFKF